MPAGFEPLRNYGIATLALEPSCFLDCSRRRKDSRAGGAHAIQKPFGRQAKMEADDSGLQFGDHVAHGFVERSAIRNGRRGRRVDAKLYIVGSQPFTPPALAIAVHRWRAMAKKVEIHRPDRALPDCLK